MGTLGKSKSDFFSTHKKMTECKKKHSLDILLLCPKSPHPNALKTFEFRPLGAEILKLWQSLTLDRSNCKNGKYHHSIRQQRMEK